MILGIIQARMSSARLPGKVLMPLAGVPMLQRVVDQVSKARGLDKVIVATSLDSSDDSVAQFCEKNSIAVFRGELSDVSRRFAQVLSAYPCEAFVRVTGDSPIIDPAIITAVIERYQKGGFEVVSNTLVRSYPKGQSVEVIDSELFTRVQPTFQTDNEREHVTQHFHMYQSRFNIGLVSHSEDLSAFNLSVDTATDMERVSKVIMTLSTRGHPRFSWLEALSCYRAQNS